MITMASSKIRTTVEAAGGILYRRRGTHTPAEASDKPIDGIEVCLVHRPKYDDWSWPKGKVDPNESHRHAAVREIGEETGLPVALGPWLGEVEYPLAEEGNRKRHTRNRNVDTKHVVYWMARPIDDEQEATRLAQAFGPVHKADVGEIDDIVWLPVNEARRKLTHSSDRDMLALFVDRIEEGAAEATPVIIVRHGKAEARKSWKGTDENRPITPRGAAAAYALTDELACYDPVRLTTSPWMRCVETLQMFAWQVGRDMTFLEPLTEDAFAANPDASWDCFRDQIRTACESGQATAICMHRPVIGGIFAHLRALCASKSLSKRLIAKSPYMPTGTAVALFVTDGANGPTIIDIQKVVPLVH